MIVALMLNLCVLIPFLPCNVIDITFEFEIIGGEGHPKSI